MSKMTISHPSSRQGESLGEGQGAPCGLEPKADQTGSDDSTMNPEDDSPNAGQGPGCRTPDDLLYPPAPPVPAATEILNAWVASQPQLASQLGHGVGFGAESLAANCTTFQSQTQPTAACPTQTWPEMTFVPVQLQQVFLPPAVPAVPIYQNSCQSGPPMAAQNKTDQEAEGCGPQLSKAKETKKQKAVESETSKKRLDSHPAIASTGSSACSNEPLRAGKQAVKEGGSNRKGNVPNPEIRAKLSAGCTDNICFLTAEPGHFENLADLKIVEDSGFQDEVRAFLDDPDFSWKALAVVRMPPYQSSKSYGIPDCDSNILGVVVIKSADDLVMSLKVSAGLWLKKKDLHLTRRIISQVVLQVFGRNPTQRNHDVRRNHFTIKGVGERTPIAARIISFTKDGELQPEADSIDLKVALKGKNGLELLKQAFLSSNLKITGEDRDFIEFAELVANRLKRRPEMPKGFNRAKDFSGTWLPGNLFMCTITEELAALLELGSRKEVDGNIVVLLPSKDQHGPLPLEENEVIVAVVDTKMRKTMLIPRSALHPLDCKRQEDLEDFLRDKYRFEVLVKSEGDNVEQPRKGCLCMNVSQSKRSMVQYDDVGEPESVDPAHLSDPRDLRQKTDLRDAGRETKTLASSEQTERREAEKTQREVLEKRRGVLGEDHQDTLNSMHNLRSFVSSRDRHDWQFCQSNQEHRSVRVEDSLAKACAAADSLQQRVPADHSDLLKQRALLANHESSRLQEAEELLQRVVPASCKMYGLDHPRTQRAIKNLVFVLEELGKDKDADQWRQQVVPDPLVQLQEKYNLVACCQRYGLEHPKAMEDLVGLEDCIILLLTQLPLLQRLQLQDILGLENPLPVDMQLQLHRLRWPLLPVQGDADSATVPPTADELEEREL